MVQLSTQDGYTPHPPPPCNVSSGVSWESDSIFSFVYKKNNNNINLSNYAFILFTSY